MRHLKTFRGVLLAGALALAGASSSHAITIGYSGILSLVPDPTDPGNDFTLTLPKFNTALGTLTSARLYFREDLSVTTLTFENLSAAPLIFDFGVQSELALNFANSADALDSFEGSTIALFDTRKLAINVPGSCRDQGLGVGGNSLPVLPGDCTPLSMGGNQLVSAQLGGNPVSALNPYTVSNTGAVYANSNDYPFSVGTSFLGLYAAYLDVANLGAYSGAGNFTLAGETEFTTVITSNGGNLKIDLQSTRALWAEIDYTYTPAVSTPEPGTWGLMGSALLGALALRKRLKR
jgi:hypothetical protein